MHHTFQRISLWIWKGCRWQETLSLLLHLCRYVLVVGVCACVIERSISIITIDNTINRLVLRPFTTHTACVWFQISSPPLQARQLFDANPASPAEMSNNISSCGLSVTVSNNLCWHWCHHLMFCPVIFGASRLIASSRCYGREYWKGTSICSNIHTQEPGRHKCNLSRVRSVNIEYISGRRCWSEA